MRRRHFGNTRELPSGRYQASYWHEGRRFIAEETFAAKADASAWLANIETDIGRGSWIDPRGGRMTVQDLAAEWLAINPAKRADTWATDDYHIRVHIIPAMGARQIRNVTPRAVQQFVTDLSSSLAPATVARGHGVLRAMFAYAVECDFARTFTLSKHEVAPVKVTRANAPSDRPGDRAG